MLAPVLLFFLIPPEISGLLLLEQNSAANAVLRSQHLKTGSALSKNAVVGLEISEGVATYHQLKLFLRQQHQHRKETFTRKAVDDNLHFATLVTSSRNEIIGDAVLTSNIKAEALHLSGILALNNTHYFMAPAFWNDSTGSFVHKLEPVQLHATATRRCAVEKLPRKDRIRFSEGRQSEQTPESSSKVNSKSPPPASQPAATSRVLELAVFSDYALFKSFEKKYRQKALENVTNYVMTIVNSMNYLYQDASLNAENKIQIRLTHLEIFSKPVKSIKTADGNEGVYLPSFCGYAGSKNKGRKKWDHAVMLTGLDLKDEESRDIIGVAYTASMCDPLYSCSLIEGSSFLAAYTLAHELGHSLGMNHDGEENNRECDGKKYIMAAIEGAGQTLWSKCSNQNMRSYLAGRSTIRGATKPDCLKTSRVRSGRKQRPSFPYSAAKLPGQVYSAQTQCTIAMGGDGAAVAGPASAEACQELYCSNGTYAYRTHPALEGTSCGKSKWCKRGACVSKL